MKPHHTASLTRLSVYTALNVFFLRGENAIVFMRQGSVEMALGLKASLAHQPAQYGRKMPCFLARFPSMSAPIPSA